MANKYTVMSEEAIRYMCGLIRDIVSLPTDVINNINLSDTQTFSNIHIKNLIDQCLQDANKYSDEVVNALTHLVAEKIDFEPTLDNTTNKLNTLLLYSKNNDNNYTQYLRLTNELLNLGDTSLSLTDYLKITDAASTYTKQTDFNSLKTEVDKKVNKTDLTTHTDDTDIHVTSADRTKWNEVDNKIDKTSILTAISASPSDNNLLSEKAVNNTFVKKTDITTTINSTSTDNELPTAKSVFDNIKNNGLIWQGAQHLQNSQESTIFNYCKSNFTVGRICGFRLEPKDGSGYFSSASVTIIYCLSSVNYGWILGLSDKSGIPMAIIQITDGLKKWQRVCTTTVPDVGLTKLEASSDMVGGVQYYVKNGICYVNVIGLSSSTMSTGSQEIVSGLPVPAITTNVWYSIYSNSPTGGSLLIRIDDTGKLINHIGSNNVVYYGSFSYPVAE